MAGYFFGAFNSKLKLETEDAFWPDCRCFFSTKGDCNWSGVSGLISACSNTHAIKLGPLHWVYNSNTRTSVILHFVQQYIQYSKSTQSTDATHELCLPCMTQNQGTVQEGMLTRHAFKGPQKQHTTLLWSKDLAVHTPHYNFIGEKRCCRHWVFKEVDFKLPAYRDIIWRGKGPVTYLGEQPKTCNQYTDTTLSWRNHKLGIVDQT